MSASPGYAYQNDILGNRTSRNYSTTYDPAVRLYQWDDLNRMTATAGVSPGARYVYRADGMRVEKIADITLQWIEDPFEPGSGYYDQILNVNKPTTRYFYDGQMAVEDDFTQLAAGRTTVTVTRYGIGARGIDFMEKTQAGQPTVTGFPIYDGHGNMIATLGRSGSSYALGDMRTYDAWGSLRSGNQAGDPKQRYCANLGHVQDDESSLIYMRARYYEPWTGRFLSEDPVKTGANWFTYASSNPIKFFDPDGQEPLPSDVDGWIKWILTKYGGLQDQLSAPQLKILSAGASACAALTLWAARADSFANIATAAGLGAPWIATMIPWLPGLLLSMGSLARLGGAGMRIAAALIALSTLIAFLSTDVE